MPSLPERPRRENTNGELVWLSSALETKGGIEYAHVTFHTAHVPHTDSPAIFGYPVPREPFPLVPLVFPCKIRTETKILLFPLIEAELDGRTAPTNARSIRVNIQPPSVEGLEGLGKSIQLQYKATKEGHETDESLGEFDMPIPANEAPRCNSDEAHVAVSPLNASKRPRFKWLRTPRPKRLRPTIRNSHPSNLMIQGPSAPIHASAHDVAPPPTSISRSLGLPPTVPDSGRTQPGVDSSEPINPMKRSASHPHQPEDVSTGTVVSSNAHVLAAPPSHMTPSSGPFPAFDVSTTLGFRSGHARARFSQSPSGVPAASHSPMTTSSGHSDVSTVLSLRTGGDTFPQRRHARARESQSDLTASPSPMITSSGPFPASDVVTIRNSGIPDTNSLPQGNPSSEQ